MSLVALLPLLGNVLDRVLPDKQAAAEAKLKLLEMEQAGQFKSLDTEVAIAKAQTDVNAVEAASSSLFVSGWRPAVGWVCVAVLACNFIGVPLLAWLSTTYNIPPPPRLEMAELFQLLLGMLGLGGLRTAEKLRGVAAR